MKKTERFQLCGEGNYRLIASFFSGNTDSTGWRSGKRASIFRLCISSRKGRRSHEVVILFSNEDFRHKTAHWGQNYPRSFRAERSLLHFSKYWIVPNMRSTLLFKGYPQVEPLFRMKAGDALAEVCGGTCTSMNLVPPLSRALEILSERRERIRCLS